MNINSKGFQRLSKADQLTFLKGKAKELGLDYDTIDSVQEIIDAEARAEAREKAKSRYQQKLDNSAKHRKTVQYKDNRAVAKNVINEFHTDEAMQYLKHNRQLINLPVVDRDDPEQVAARCDLYFEMCTENQMRPNVAGLSLAFAIQRRSLLAWVQGETHSKTSPIVNKAYVMLNAYMEDIMMNSKIQPINGIFLMKNNYGYTDQTEHIVTKRHDADIDKTEEELKKKYAEDMVIDVDFTETE